jgi:hypothetical protein
MALQNLMGNLVLDDTAQQTNTLLVGQNSLLSELNQLTDTLNQLMVIQSSSMPTTVPRRVMFLVLRPK